MKEIKFKAWDKKEKRMFAVTQISFQWQPTHPELPQGTFDGIFLYGQNDEKWRSEIELMQFSGLKDRLGSECYEEDIIYAYRRDDTDKEHPQKLKITFLNGCFMVGTCTTHEFYRLYQQDFERIGNFFETPGILDEQDPDIVEKPRELTLDEALYISSDQLDWELGRD